MRNCDGIARRNPGSRPGLNLSAIQSGPDDNERGQGCGQEPGCERVQGLQASRKKEEITDLSNNVRVVDCPASPVSRAKGTEGRENPSRYVQLRGDPCPQERRSHGTGTF